MKTCVIIGIVFAITLAVLLYYMEAEKKAYEAKWLKVEIEEDPLRVLFDAIAAVEEVGGDPCAFGVDGEVGLYQITVQYVDDLNRIYGEGTFNYAERCHPLFCELMMTYYWNYYAIYERLGREPTYEDLARIHKGGPNGWKNFNTISYWKKVERKMQ